MKTLKLIITIVFLLSLSNCASLLPKRWNPIHNEVKQTPEYSGISVDSKTACSKYRVNEWVVCMENILKDYEGIKNSKPSEKIIEEVRDKTDEDYLIRTSEICFGPTLCRTRTEKIYDPSVWTMLKRYTVVGIISFAIGFVVGIL